MRKEDDDDDDDDKGGGGASEQAERTDESAREGTRQRAKLISG